MQPAVNIKKICLIAAFTAALTFVLVGLGGFVRATGAGLSCPDWPLCFGKVVPPSMGNGVAQEWVHRVIATVVGLLSIGLLLIGFSQRKQSKKFFNYTLFLFGLVVFQGVLGGLTVIYSLNPFIVTAHLLFGTLFFQSLVVLIADGRVALKVRAFAQPIPATLNFLIVAVFLQMVLGGFVGASGAALACPDLPLCQGELIPEPIHGPQVVHMLHRTLGVLILMLALLVSWQQWRDGVNKFLKGVSFAVSVLVLLQVALGVANVAYIIPVSVAVAHLVVAQVILALLLIGLVVSRAGFGLLTADLRVTGALGVEPRNLNDFSSGEIKVNS